MTDSLTPADLSFVQLVDDTRIVHNLWCPERPVDREDAEIRGREYAIELHMFMQVRGSGGPVVFTNVLRAISRSGVYGDVEAAFCNYFGIILAGLPVQHVAEVLTLHDEPSFVPTAKAA